MSSLRELAADERTARTVRLDSSEAIEAAADHRIIGLDKHRLYLTARHRQQMALAA
ncbi:hypothetical protein LG314_07630 [Agrococcus terreus]|uniref:hypothetical protein n=1 Tax=Agrococcus terreus TaxID=574649 RepID=UPI00384AB939